jgi:hypothetical protein
MLLRKLHENLRHSVAHLAVLRHRASHPLERLAGELRNHLPSGSPQTSRPAFPHPLRESKTPVAMRAVSLR